MSTETKNTIPWRLRTSRKSRIGALSPEKISELATNFHLDISAFEKLSLNLDIALSPQLHISQPEFRQAKVKKGVQEVYSTIKALHAAEDNIKAAINLLENVDFINPLPIINKNDILDHHFDKIHKSIEHIQDIIKFLDTMAKNNLVMSLDVPDKRRVRDVRREIVCVSIFSFWSEIGRKLTYTTDPVTSRRVGELFEFVNAVVECISEPPSRLNTETIKLELENYKTNIIPNFP